MRERSTMTIGVDLGDEWSHLCVLDEAGAVVERGRVRTTPEALSAWFGKRPPARVAMEAGTHSPYASRAVASSGHETLVANPRRVCLIYGEHTKSDQVDAETLARLARVDPRLLSSIEHRTERQQADRELLRARDALVRTRTDLVNHVRGAGKSLGARLPSYHARAFARKAEQHLPEILRPALAPILERIADLTRTIHELGESIEQVSAERYPVTAHLRSVRGVGPVTGLAFVLAIGDPCRFARSRDVGSYFGLRPRQRQSGQRDPQLHITKAGDGFVRRLLLQCAHSILGPFGGDSDLRRWGLKLIERGGGKTAHKKAVVAVARKLAVLLHRLWVTGEVCDPLRVARSEVAVPARCTRCAEVAQHGLLNGPAGQPRARAAEPAPEAGFRGAGPPPAPASGSGWAGPASRLPGCSAPSSSWPAPSPWPTPSGPQRSHGAAGCRIVASVMKPKSIIDSALQPPREEHARVAREIIASLDGPADQDVDAAWLADVEHRLDEVERGATELVPWDTVRERVTQRLRAVRR